MNWEPLITQIGAILFLASKAFLFRLEKFLQLWSYDQVYSCSLSLLDPNKMLLNILASFLQFLEETL